MKLSLHTDFFALLAALVWIVVTSVALARGAGSALRMTQLDRDVTVPTNV